MSESVAANDPSFVDFLVDEELLTSEQASLLRREASYARELIGGLMLRKRMVSVRQMSRILEAHAEHPGTRVGDLAVEMGYVARADVENVAREQHTGRGDVVQRILAHRWVEERVLQDALLAFVRLKYPDALTVSV